MITPHCFRASVASLVLRANVPFSRLLSSGSSLDGETKVPVPVVEEMRQQVSSKELLDLAKTMAFEYIDSAEGRPVYPSQAQLEDLSVFDEPISETTQDGAAVLQMLHQYGSPATVMTTGGRYFGFVNGNVVPTAAAAGWMAQVWDQNAALHVMSPVASKLEEVVENWCVDLLGLPQGTAMGLVSGTSVANICGLAAGRYALLSRQGWDVNSKGLFGAPPIRVVVSDQAHSSVWKGLALLGLGNDRVEKAGHVSTGAFDDFDFICGVAKEAGSWVHVDGAFGLWAAASSNLKHLCKGIENADSFSVDGHKTLQTPYDVGIILCKDRSILNQTMSATGSYIQESAGRDGMFYTPDMSRRARSIEVWATLKYLGREGVEQLMDSMVANAQDFGRQLEAAGFHILNHIVFNQCLVKCDTPEETQQTLINIQSSGVMWCGGSVWQGEPAIRISVCSWSTSEEDVSTSVEAMVQAREGAKKLLEQY